MIKKAAIDTELDHPRNIHTDLKVRTSRMQMDEQPKCQDGTDAGGCRGWRADVKLADTPIDRVYVYLGDQLEIVWKMEDFCMVGM